MNRILNSAWGIEVPLQNLRFPPKFLFYLQFALAHATKQAGLKCILSQRKICLLNEYISIKYFW